MKPETTLEEDQLHLAYYNREVEPIIKSLCSTLKCQPEKIVSSLYRLLYQCSDLREDLEKLKKELEK